MRATPEGHPELAVAWALYALAPEEAAEFSEHLPECSACRTIVAETEDVGALLATAVPEEEPPPALRDRILAAAADDSEASSLSSSDSDAASSTVVPLRPRWVRRAVAGVALAAAVALVVVIGGLVNANRDLARERDTAAAQAAQSRQVVELVDAASRTPHTVLATPQGGFVGLVVDRGAGPEFLATGLPANAADQTYVLWGLEGGRPVGLGTFDMSGSAPVASSVPSTGTGGRYAGFAVSLEPGRAVPAAPTQIVASGQLAG
ncbi:anti-sigma factor domain-containing protein [Actinomycetospora termitidis]|uniref:Regulator of SigK n=1 Tax=Actinomycetospora termitidis TaxID=3053470 RepID=A0ABT7M7L4_9PSEU|nr:anti-sigma factor [Actinomycetospora sp. Odt1-22]MDL5156668.1 anti-sigma factor [Actinomycetospora sp. Odt1-22]